LLSAFGELPVLALDVDAARRFADLRRQYRRHGAADLKIAAIVVGSDATLLTRNVRDFQGINGLSVENPLA
jgi:predicted nucleic acid-binding protein